MPCLPRPEPRPLSQCYACWTTDGLMFWKQVGKWGSIELIIPLPTWMKFFIPFVSNFGVKWSHYLTIIVFIFQLFRLFTFTWPFGSLVCKLTFYIQVHTGINEVFIDIQYSCFIYSDFWYMYVSCSIKQLLFKHQMYTSIFISGFKFPTWLQKI